MSQEVFKNFISCNRHFVKLLTFASLLLITLTVLAFNGPSQSPPNGSSQFWLLNGTNIYYNSGNIGIGTTTPSYKLSVEGGDIYASGALRGSSSICIGASCISSWQGIPSGAVMFFNLSSCPSGWTELTSARGRYIVGLPAGGTLAATVGTALSNQENRPVGQHSHTIYDPGHYHTNSSLLNGSTGWGGSAGAGAILYSGDSNDTISFTGITVNDAGTVAGTNAPYIQLLACQKN
ncbi:MAG: hypothetical protein N2Z68_01380 [Patescibacteria group bacterium]|nr:hypothetical protein [Patescibacteria group bacterium]